MYEWALRKRIGRVMLDKEVGELWRKARSWHWNNGARIIALIEKLVEERQLHDWHHKDGHELLYKTFDDTLKPALDDFGIDEEEWNRSHTR